MFLSGELAICVGLCEDIGELHREKLCVFLV